MTTALGLFGIAATTGWLIAVCREVQRSSRCRLLRERALR